MISLPTHTRLIPDLTSTFQFRYLSLDCPLIRPVLFRLIVSQCRFIYKISIRLRTKDTALRYLLMSYPMSELLAQVTTQNLRKAAP